jgi:tetratricopeptide (TPR) repeat protein
MERAVEPDGPDVAAILTSLAAIAQDRADYAEAQDLFGRSASILDAAGGDDHDVMRLRIQALGSLGAVLRTRGRYAEAEPILCRALVLAAEALGTGDIEVGALLNHLGILHKDQGRFAEASPLYRRALRRSRWLTPFLAAIT